MPGNFNNNNEMRITILLSTILEYSFWKKLNIQPKSFNKQKFANLATTCTELGLTFFNLIFRMCHIVFPIEDFTAEGWVYDIFIYLFISAGAIEYHP